MTKYTKLQTYLIDGMEKYIRKILYWENDSVSIGKIIRFIHHISTSFLIFWTVIIHTIYPSYFLLCILYFYVVLIWIQHIITGGCIISKLEQKLIGDTESFTDPILEALHIPITPESSSGIVIFGSTIVVCMLTLEISCRTVTTINSYLRF